MENRIFLGCRALILAIFLILAMPLAFAYPVEMQLNGNTEFNTAVYQCTDSTCSSLNAQYASDSGNPTHYTINNEGSGDQYFAEYDYTTDRCHVSHSYITWFDETTDNGPWVYDVIFNKKTSCEADVLSTDYDAEITDNEIQEITVNVKSPFNLNPDGLQIVPEELEQYYSTNVEVSIVIEHEGMIVYEETLNSDILWSNENDFVFTFTPVENGVYDYNVKTKVNDCMCESYVEDAETGSFEVSYTTSPHPQDTTPPEISINSPESKVYDTRNILVEIEASDENLKDVWFVFGSSFTYNEAVYITFTEGTNQLVAWAEDEVGNTNSASVIFTVTLPSNGINLLPIADFDYNPVEPEEDEQITFDASLSYDPDGTIDEYYWNFGDGSSAHGKIITHEYINDGTFQATLTVTDNDGESSYLTNAITVSEKSEDEEDDRKGSGSSRSKRIVLEITDIQKVNAQCGNLAKLTFRIRNNGDLREDVLIRIKNKELGIDEPRIITLESDEEELVNFYIHILSNVKERMYYFTISTEIRGKIIEEIYPVQVKCNNALPGSSLTSSSGSGMQTTKTGSSTAEIGITGSVIGPGGNILSRETLAPAIIITLLILNILVVLAIMTIKKR